MYLGASFFLVLTSALAGFSWNFISYVVIMFFCGYFSLFNYIVGFVLGIYHCKLSIFKYIGSNTVCLEKCGFKSNLNTVKVKVNI